MEKLLGEGKKARASIHRRGSRSSIEEQHKVTEPRRGSSRGSHQMEQIPSDLDPVKELAELADFHAEDSEMVNPATELVRFLAQTSFPLLTFAQDLRWMPIEPDHNALSSLSRRLANSVQLETDSLKQSLSTTATLSLFRHNLA